MEYAQAHWPAAWWRSPSSSSSPYSPAPPAGLGLRWTACACASAAPTPGFELDIDLALPGRRDRSVRPFRPGKSTCLRCIAGLEKAAEGEVTINGETWQDSRHNLFVAPHRRALGYVFQDANLFRHLTVRRNLAFGPSASPPPNAASSWNRPAPCWASSTCWNACRNASPAASSNASASPAPPHQPAPAADGRASGILDLKRKGEILPYLWSACTRNRTSRCSMSATRQTKWRAWPITRCCWRTALARASGPIGETPARSRPCRWRWTTTPGGDRGTVSDHDRPTAC